jgi:hypothetical protein
MLAELREYTIVPGQTDALLSQFREVSLPLFAEYGITAYGPWLRQITKGEQLIYVLEFDDEADRERKWTAFRADARWVDAVARTNATGPLIAGNQTTEMRR